VGGAGESLGGGRQPQDGILLVAVLLYSCGVPSKQRGGESELVWGQGLVQEGEEEVGAEGVLQLDGLRLGEHLVQRMTLARGTEGAGEGTRAERMLVAGKRWQHA
jgi:hypothetical protein